MKVWGLFEEDDDYGVPTLNGLFSDITKAMSWAEKSFLWQKERNNPDSYKWDTKRYLHLDYPDGHLLYLHRKDDEGDWYRTDVYIVQLEVVE